MSKTFTKNCFNLFTQISGLYNYLSNAVLKNPEKAVEITKQIKNILEYYNNNIKKRTEYYINYEKIENAIDILKKADYLWTQIISLWTLCEDTEKLNQFKADNEEQNESTNNG